MNLLGRPGEAPCGLIVMEGALATSDALSLVGVDDQDPDVIPLGPNQAEPTIKVMYNNCYGGFRLSDRARAMYKARKGLPQDGPTGYSDDEFPRHDPDMVAVVELLGHEASGQCSEIQLEEVPAKYTAYYYVDEYDGSETVRIDYKQYKLDCIHTMLSTTDAFREATYHQRAVLEDVLDIIRAPLD